MERQKIFVYSNEEEGMFVLVLYSYTLIYEFIIGNKHEVLGSKAKLWGLGAKPPPARSNRGYWGEAPSVWRFFCIFLIKISHFETYLTQHK